MSMILHVLRFLRVGLIIIKDSHLNFDMKYLKISGNTGPSAERAVSRAMPGMTWKTTLRPAPATA